MMNRVFCIVFCFLSFFAFSQKECEYSTVINDSLGTYKVTKSYLLHQRIFGGTEKSIFASLINSNDTPLLSLQLIHKSSDFTPAFCFNAASKIHLQLTNGSIVTLVYAGDESCSTSLSNEGKNIRILTGNFLFLKQGFEELEKSPISLMRIVFATETVDYIIKSELKSELDNISYYPETYFMENLKCVK